MSETAPESSGGGGGGNVFTRKIGPLPMWAWMAILLVAVVVYSMYKKNQSSSTTTASTAANTPGGVDASLVPQFINQTYTNVEPPAAPNVTTVNSNDVNSNNTAPVTTGNTGTTTVNSPTTVNNPAPPVKQPPPPPKSSGGQQYTTVTVAKWTATNTPWNSTLSGIANHYKVPGGYEALAKLNKIQNANLIYPGQKIKVPVG